MAHLRGTLEAGGKKTSRQGTKVSGLVAEINGWTTGCKVTMFHDPHTGEDVITVSRTSGSHDDGTNTIVANWREKAL